MQISAVLPTCMLLTALGVPFMVIVIKTGPLLHFGHSSDWTSQHWPAWLQFTRAVTLTIHSVIEKSNIWTCSSDTFNKLGLVIKDKLHSHKCISMYLMYEWINRCVWWCDYANTYEITFTIIITAALPYIFLVQQHCVP